MKRTPCAVNHFRGIVIKGGGRVHLGNRIVLEDEEEPKTKGALAAVDWLSSPNHYQRRIDLLSKRHGQTGEWLLHTPEFHKWVNDENQTLWCYGIAGSGKSVIASLIADRLIQYKQNFETNVAFIFADPSIEHRATPQDVITSLLKQFLIEHELPTFSSHLENLYMAHRQRKTRPSWEECLDTLRLSVDKASRVYIVIDGLGHLGLDDESMTLLLDTLEGWPTLNLLVTTRSRTPFTHSKRPRAYTNISASSQDIKSYIEHRSMMVPGFQNLLARDASLQATFADCIVNRSQGMFLMAKLHFDFIATKHCARDIRSALHAYPESIKDVYRESWLKIHKQDKDTASLAVRVLDLVCYTYEPLTLSGLQHALSATGANDYCQDDIIDGNLLISICFGLIFLAPDQTVQFIHPTARQFYGDLHAYNLRALGFRLRLAFPWSLKYLMTACKHYSIGYVASTNGLKESIIPAIGLRLRSKGQRSERWDAPLPTGLKHALPLLICILVIVYLIF